MKAFFNRFAFAFAAIATLLFAAPAYSNKSTQELKAEAGRNHDDNLSKGKDNGGLFGAFAYYKGVFPSDIRFKTNDSVGKSCDDNGSLNPKAKFRCKIYVSKSTGTDYLVRMSPDKDNTFFYKKVGDREVLTPYTMYDKHGGGMSFASNDGQQHASAHGLSAGGTQLAKAPAATPASTAPVQVAAANCANMQNRSARTACEKTTKQGDQTSPIATFGGMVEAFGRKIKP